MGARRARGTAFSSSRPCLAGRRTGACAADARASSDVSSRRRSTDRSRPCGRSGGRDRLCGPRECISRCARRRGDARLAGSRAAARTRAQHQGTSLGSRGAEVVAAGVDVRHRGRTNSSPDTVAGVKNVLGVYASLLHRLAHCSGAWQLVRVNTASRQNQVAWLGQRVDHQHFAPRAVRGPAQAQTRGTSAQPVGIVRARHAGVVMPAGDRAVSESHREELPCDRTFAANQCSERISGTKDPNLSSAVITRIETERLRCC